MKRNINLMMLSVIIMLLVIRVPAIPASAADNDHPITEPVDDTVWSGHQAAVFREPPVKILNT